MNQIKKSFWKDTFRVFIPQTSLIFILFLMGLGGALWIQSLFLAFMVSLFIVWLFFIRLKQFFSGKPLRGTDPWHFLHTTEKGFPAGVQVLVCESSLPFFASFDMYGVKKVFISSFFLNRFESSGLEKWAGGLACFFKKGYTSFFTWICYLFFVLTLPFQVGGLLFRKVNSVKVFFDWLELGFCFIFGFFLNFFFKKTYLKADKDFSAFFETKNIYLEHLLQMESYLSASGFSPPAFLTSLFIINPLTHSFFCPSMHPCLSEREAFLTTHKTTTKGA